MSKNIEGTRFVGVCKVCEELEDFLFAPSYIDKIALLVVDVAAH